MRNTFTIQDHSLLVDADATSAFYLTQNPIVRDCSCEDCLYYVTELVRQPFEIFRILSLMGVDLVKNLIAEPTGVSCVVVEGICYDVQHAYRVVGQITPPVKNDVVYERTEHGYTVRAHFTQDGVDEIRIDFFIEKER